MGLKVSDCMVRDVVSLTPEMSLREAAAILSRRRISGGPVLGPRRDVIGILSESDMIRFFAAQSKSVNPLAWLEQTNAVRASEEQRITLSIVRSQSTKIKDVMTRDVVPVSPGATLEAAALLMHERDVNRLPVVEASRLVGIITRGDVVRAMAGAAAIRIGAGRSAGEGIPGARYVPEPRPI
jgi:CBS domain-containing protein